MQDGFHIWHTCSPLERAGNWQSVLELSLTTCVTFIERLNYCVVPQCPCLNCEGEDKVVQEGCFPDYNLMISKARPKALRFRSPHLLLLSHSHFWDHFSKCLKLSNVCLIPGLESEPLIHEWTPMSPGSTQMQASISQAWPRPAFSLSLPLPYQHFDSDPDPCSGTPPLRLFWK